MSDTLGNVPHRRLPGGRHDGEIRPRGDARSFAKRSSTALVGASG